MPTSAAQPRRTLVEERVKIAAAQMFFDKGVASTSLADIATALGTARTALYHYYASKDELLVALITECAAQARQILAADAASRPTDANPYNGSGAAPLWDAVWQLATFALEHPDRVRLLDAASELPPEAERVARTVNRQFFRELAEMIRTGIDVGVFRDVDAGVAAHAIVGATRSLVWWFNPAGRRTADYIARQVADSAVRGLLSHAWPEPPSRVLAAAARLRDDVDSLARTLRPDATN